MSKNHQDHECTGAEMVVTPMSLIDRLKAKRAQIARDANTRVKKLDRQIALLAQSDAEQIMQDAQDILDNA